MPAHNGIFRLLLPFTAVIASIVTISGVVAHVIGDRTVMNHQVRDLGALTEMLRQDLVRLGEPMAEAHQERLQSAAAALGMRVTFIDTGGKVVFDSEADVAQMDNHANRPEVLLARREGVGSSRRYSDSVDRDMIYVAKPIDLNNPRGWIIRLSYPRRLLGSIPLSAAVIVVISVLASLLLVLMLARVLYREWIGPALALAGAAQRMAAGEWQVRVEPDGARDLRQFSFQLNAVAAHAQKQLADLREQRGDLQALVDTLPDPIIVTDSVGKVVLINAPASRLLDVSASQARGNKLIAAVSNQQIIELFEEAGPNIGLRSDGNRSDGDGATDGFEHVVSPIQREIRITRAAQRFTFQAYATRTPGGGVLIALRDVSRAANAVQMKTDFVANASHELRTPIAAIKIAFETLNDVYQDDPVQTEKCVRVIEGHIKRLEEMLRDLLDLSRVESPDLRPTVGPVQPGELFSMVRGTLGPLARQKGVELALNRANLHCEFVSDERLLNLILKNLVENSIKFTPSGGTITMTVEPDGTDGIAIRVRDTGSGIPPEHVERVFERFYQVDPARSGSAGRGTGLGLAIVKHAVHALGGTVNLTSTVGRGTTVTCSFPLRSPEPSFDQVQTRA